MNNLELAHDNNTQQYESAKTVIPNATTLMSKESDGITRRPICGPLYLDFLNYRWAKTQVLGLIGGTGIGKTSLNLNILKDILNNNPNEIAVLVSLEMSTPEILERWNSIIGRNKELSDRFFILDPYDTENNQVRILGIQDVFLFCDRLKKDTGKGLCCVSIDHIGLLDNCIDTTVEPTFGHIPRSRKSNKRIKISPQKSCDNLKKLSIILDTFLIVLSQTTKSKGRGYIPLFKDAAYGMSQFENICDFLIGLWQPLHLVNAASKIKFTAFQYSKIRHLSAKDLITTNQPLVLVHDLRDGSYTPPKRFEMDIFNELLINQLEVAKSIGKSAEGTLYAVFNTNTESVINLQGLEQEV